MYGSRRMTVISHLAGAAERVTRAARLFVHLTTRQTRWGVTDLYAAAMTARFMAAHELLDKAEALVGDDPDIELLHVSQPIWFGTTTLHEEN
ncbi:hypothetical protein ACGFNV_22185 [Streptomyces sp. NPDC048751]|uniref:hypothetical protein n=1 Tax=Streptomyces sp. NPDC048751 TaxID=3365591 RepID=UPI00371E1FAD